MNKLILTALSSLMGAALAIGIISVIPDEPLVQRVIEHAHAADAGEFAPTMEGILDAAIEPGNKIETLVNGDEIFPAMLAAIGEARKTINFETYICGSGDIAERFAAALSERARDGIGVNVILDYVGSLPMEERLIERMQEAGVKLVRFRPLHWYTIDRLNYRSHHKLLVIDGRLGFTGGVGIADEWKGDARNPNEWRDNHYRLEGGIVAGLQSAFADHWLETTGEVLRGEPYFPALETRGSVALQSMKSSPFSGNQTLYLSLMLAVSAAKRHIRIGIAYFLPNAATLAQILEARNRGVEIELIVPGIWTDTEEVRRASRHFWGQLLKAGVKIYEYEPTMYHVKVVIVDDAWATLGTANLDERSFRFNDETNINVYDKVFVKEQIDLFEADKLLAREVSLEEWQRRLLQIKLSDWFWSHFRSQF